MRVTINFKVDEPMLRYAIASLIKYNTLKINKKNTIFAIKNEIESKGTSLIEFPEFWGEDIMEFYYDNMREVDTFVNRYRGIIQ